MKTVIIILLLVAATAQNLSAKDRRADPYFFGRVSTALRVETSDLKDWFGDWSFGVDAGLGIWYGTFHAGVSGGITTSALRLIGWALLEGIFEQVDPSIEEIIPNYIEFPVRFYSGFAASDERVLTLDVFFGGYSRISNVKNLPTTSEFEAGISLLLYSSMFKPSISEYFLEVSYVWPQTNRVRISLGLCFTWRTGD